MTKTCTVCGVEKPLEAFYVRAQMRDGRRSECKECTLARSGNWREANPEAFQASMDKHRAANKDRILAADRAYRERNRDNILDRQRQQRAANPEAHRASVKRSAEKNPERVAVALQRFYANNPGYIAARNARYYKENRTACIARAKKREQYIQQQSCIAEGLSQAHQAEVAALYSFCQLFAGYEVDHIVPVQGKQVTGLDVPWNMQVLTVTENRRKSNKFDSMTHQHVGGYTLQQCIDHSVLDNF